MLPSTSAPKFLLDENVRCELFAFLRSKRVDAKLVPKGSSDKEVAAMSKRERRVLVTNDADFATSGVYSKERLFALVWLRLPQADVKDLLSSFELLLLKFPSKIAGRVVVLRAGFWDVVPFGSEKLSG